MRQGIWFLLLSSLVGCARSACDERCDEWELFVDTCGAQMEEAGVPARCWDEPSAALDPASDAWHTCADGAEARRSCLRVNRQQEAAMSAEAREVRYGECEAGDAYYDAVAAQDCDAVIGGE